MAASSWAQPVSTLPTLKLDWPSIDGCPTRDEMILAIAHHLGEATGRTNVVAATAVIEVTAGYRLVLYTRSGAGAGTRELTGDTCRSVADAAVVILAIMLGQDSVAPAGDEGESVPARSGIGLPETKRRPLPSRITVKRRDLYLGATPTSRSITPHMGIGGWVPFGIAKTPLLGVMVNFGAELTGWRLLAHVGWAPEKRVAQVGDTDRGAWVTLGSAGLSVGPVFGHGRWEFMPRIGISEQVLRGEGFGVDLPAKRWAYFGSVRFGELLGLRLTSRISVQSMVDVSASLRRPALLLDPGGEVLRPARLGLDAGLFVAMRF